MVLAHILVRGSLLTCSWGDTLSACWFWNAGHSLGGALATLAAYDIRQELAKQQQQGVQVVCYSFGAPRTGNHAFARDYNHMVPDTWSIINDQVQITCCFSCMALLKQHITIRQHLFQDSLIFFAFLKSKQQNNGVMAKHESEAPILHQTLLRLCFSILLPVSQNGLCSPPTACRHQRVIQLVCVQTSCV